MKLRSVYAPKLILTAQAQFLRVMTRVVEQFSRLDLSDIAAANDLLSRVAAYVRDFADEVSTGDTLVDFEITKGLNDAAELIDAALTRNTTKTLSDAAALLDTARLRLTRVLSDLVQTGDVAKRMSGKGLTETSKPLDLAKLTPKSVQADAVSEYLESLSFSAGMKINESGQYVDGYGDYVDEDYFLKTPQLLETAFLFDVNKSLAEGAAAADALSLAFSTLLTDALDAPVDAILLRPLLGLSESQALTESQLFAVGKFLTELATFTDYTQLAARKRLTDTQPVADVLTRIAAQYRTLTDSFGTTEALIRTLTKPLSDSATPADAPKKHLFLKLLEGGEYAVSGYFEADDYVVGGIAAGDSLTIA